MEKNNKKPQYTWQQSLKELLIVRVVRWLIDKVRRWK